jgi:hypothetical protein
MATTQEAIARLRMIFETQGADAAVAEMKKLETAETSLGTTSLNLDRAFGNLERRYSETARATADYERAMRTLNAAVAQNPALAERAAAVQQTVAARYQATMQAAHQAAQAQTALGQVNQAAQATASGLASSTGLFGSALSTIGRGGLVAAAGVGAAVVAFRTLSTGVDAFAQRSRAISEFAETTGLTTRQVQGLSKEAARFGIDTEKMQTGLQRFVSQMDEFRQGGGQLLDVVRSIDAGLAEQMQQTDDTAQQLKLLQQGIEGTTDAFQKARLERAAFGRGMLALGQIDFAAGMQRTSGIPDQIIQEMKRLQGEIDASSTNISNKIYAEFGVAWERSKLQMLLYFEALIKGKALMGVDTQAKRQSPAELDEASLQELTSQAERLQEQIDRINNSTLAGTEYWDNFFGQANKGAELQTQALKKVQAELDALKAKMAAAAESPEAKSKLLTAQIADLQKLQQVLGALMPVEQQVELATKQLNQAMATAPAEYKQQIEAAKNALLDLKTVQAEMSQVDPGTYRRQLEAIDSIKAAYPGLVAQDAIRMSQLEDQLRIAQALPGVARMEAEELARINQLLLEGKDLQMAINIVAKERAVVQAQINTAAQQQLFNLRNAYGVAAAVTGAEKIRAQEQATIAALIQQGVDAELAGVVAAQERANAEAAVNAAIEQQVSALDASTEIIKAQTADLWAQAGATQKIIGMNEINVRAQQAYEQAVRAGADATYASMLAAATYNNLLAQRHKQIVEIQIAEERANRARLEQINQEILAVSRQADQEAEQAQQAFNQRMSSAQAASQQAMGEQFRSLAQAGSQTAQQILAMLEGAYGAAWLFNADQLLAPLQKAKQEVALIPQQQREQQAVDQLKQLQDEFRLGGAATPEAKAQIQWQLTYEKLIKEGVSASVAQQIANQELANTMQELAKSVDANTSALQSQLDPIYTEGRAALRIGYYGEGAGGTQRVVTGTGYANENVPASGGQASGSNLIVINNNFAAGAVMGDRRTQYQAANAYGRAIAATGK